MNARTRILERVRDALARRERMEHPGTFEGWRAERPHPLGGFVRLLEEAGGEVVRVAGSAEAARWIREFAASYPTVTIGRGVPSALRPPYVEVPPDEAALAISRARAGVGETGSIVLDARDGRRTQLLAPVHLIVLAESELYATLREVLEVVRPDLPAALGFHSGPSKSADIGDVLVRGVHGPGRLIALLVDGALDGEGS